MTMLPLRLVWSVAIALAAAFSVASAVADEAEPSTEASDASEAKQAEQAKETKPDEASKAKPAAKKPSPPKPKYPPFKKVVKDYKTHSGLLKLYQTDTKLFAEIPGNRLNKDYMVVIAIAKGIGQRPLYGGMSWGFGDDWVWQFRKVGDRIQIVRRNVRFTAKKGSPEAEAVKLAYTDSILYSLPIVTKSPGGTDVIDLTSVFMSDLPQISRVLRGFSFSASRSTWSQVKTYKDNVELRVAATYASGGSQKIDSVADTRGVTINVHYSISTLKSTGYQPRMADDRVGYFLTVVKDYSKKDGHDRYVRYINRWDLRKADASAKLSPPKKEIVFWLEKTVPFKYRKVIREGILEWNKAFEKAGFANAVQVRQQPEDADWDPEDINYNTFRWITASAGFAMGPSRVNPTTGQILDADIIFDADFLKYWKQEYETFTPQGVELLLRETHDPKAILDILQSLPENPQSLARAKHGVDPAHCSLCQGMSRQLAFGATLMAARKQGPEDLEKLIMQALKDVTMHEVGHTLGLRHNFKASRLYSLEDANNPEKTSQTGITASVMDYTPVNLVPGDTPQGDYYSTTIGPYDMWAIEYGYTPHSGGTTGEVKKLNEIAARSGQPELAYGTDEDTRSIDPDPHSARYDLGDDGVVYARRQAQLVAEGWPDIVDRMTKEGEGFQQARRAFGVLLHTHGSAMYFAARYIGGLHVSRSHKGDKDAKPPFEIVDAAKQREALDILEEQVFSDKPFEFPPELYNHLAATHWSHWGSDPPTRRDYPVHRVIATWQERILDKLMSPLTLDRMHDAELKVAADQDALTTAELLERLTKAIYSELGDLDDGEFTNRKPAISSLRRNLQRAYFKRLATVAMGNSIDIDLLLGYREILRAPQDCQTVAYSQLVALEGRIESVLKGNAKLDSYSRAHLEETASRIRKVVEARLLLFTP